MVYVPHERLYAATIDGPGRVAYDPLLKAWTRALARTTLPATQRTDIIDITDRLAQKRDDEDTQRLRAVIKRFDSRVEFP